jgi:diguanylate cyclase (GGDEF)-like protein
LSDRVLVVDPSVPVSGVLRRYLESADLEVRVAHHLEEAVDRFRDQPVDLVFAAASETFDGETLCQKLKGLDPKVPVVLLYPPGEDDPQGYADRVGADAFLVGPIKRGTVVSFARAMLKGAQQARRIAALESQAAHDGGEFELFKRVLLMEVKRSRRYKYPVSFLLVALDGYGERVAGLSAPERTSLLAEALSIITAAVRDIDLAVPFKDERYLVFLPHTPRKGAVIVGERVREKVGKLLSTLGITASVGVASYEPSGSEAKVSFGSLMKDATQTLRKAQQAGGDRVEAGEKAKRDRISLG